MLVGREMCLMRSVLSCLLLLLASAWSFGQTERTISWPELASAEPWVKGDDGNLLASTVTALEVVSVTVNGKEIVLGMPFRAEGEWLKTLSVTVKNISDKPISAVRLNFGLPEAKYGSGSSGFSLEYGKALSTGIDYGPQAPIAPGENVVLMRNERHYNRDRDGIVKRTGVTDFRSVLIGSTVVEFIDGTVWMAYRLPITTKPS